MDTAAAEIVTAREEQDAYAEPILPGLLGQPAAEVALETMAWSDGREWDEYVVVSEIQQYAGTIIHAAYEIGRRLIWARMVKGERPWCEWCQEKLRFSERTARNYMRIARWLHKHPRALEPLAGAGLKKVLLLTSLPDRDVEALLDGGAVPGVRDEDLYLQDIGELPYRELAERLRETTRDLGAVTSERDAAQRRASDLEEKLRTTQAKVGEQVTEDDQEALERLGRWHEEFDKFMAEVGFHLDQLARRYEDLPPVVQAHARGLLAFLGERLRVEDCRFRALAGDQVAGAEWPVQEDSPVYPLPEGRFLPFARQD